MNTLSTIRLYGKLGAKFGRVHRLAVNSGAEAIRALCVTIPGFERYLATAKDDGVGFAVFLGKRNITQDELHVVTHQEIRIAPILMGSKGGGFFSIILGAALIATSFLIPGSGFLAAAFFNAGVSLVLGGIVQLLSPPPKDRNSKDKADNEPNYAFNGPVNTQAQGHCVPLLYGKMITGSAIISAGISNDVVPPSSPPLDVKFYAVTIDFGSSNRLMVSDDGAAWAAVPQTDFLTVAFHSIAANPDDGNNLVATDDTDFYYSNNRGLNWAKFATGGIGAIGRRIAAGPNGKFMAWTVQAGVTKAVLSTDGGQTWAVVGTVSGVTTPNDLEYGNGAWVLVSGNTGGGIYSSLNDGGTWVQRVSGTDTTGIGFNGTDFLACSNAGDLRYSNNGIAFVLSASTIPSASYAICGAAGRFHIGDFLGNIYITDDLGNTLTKKRNRVGSASGVFYSRACLFNDVVFGAGGGGSDTISSSQDAGTTFADETFFNDYAICASLVQ